MASWLVAVPHVRPATRNSSRKQLTHPIIIIIISTSLRPEANPIAVVRPAANRDAAVAKMLRIGLLVMLSLLGLVRGQMQRCDTRRLLPSPGAAGFCSFVLRSTFPNSGPSLRQLTSTAITPAPPPPAAAAATCRHHHRSPSSCLLDTTLYHHSGAVQPPVGNRPSSVEHHRSLRVVILGQIAAG